MTGCRTDDSTGARRPPGLDPPPRRIQAEFQTDLEAVAGPAACRARADRKRAASLNYLKSHVIPAMTPGPDIVRQAWRVYLIGQQTHLEPLAAGAKASWNRPVSRDRRARFFRSLMRAVAGAAGVSLTIHKGAGDEVLR